MQDCSPGVFTPTVATARKPSRPSGQRPGFAVVVCVVVVSSAPRPPRALTAPHPAGSPDARRGDERYAGRVRTVAYELERACLEADLATGTVLVPGVRAPRLVSNELAGRMRPGSVLVDISTDQGACSADSRPATHADPTYTVHGSVF